MKALFILFILAILTMAGCSTNPTTDAVTNVPLPIASSAAATLPAAANLPATLPAAATITQKSADLNSMLAQFMAGNKKITPADIQAHAANLKANLDAFIIATAPIANAAAGIADIAAAATGNAAVIPAINIANSAIQAAAAVTKAQPPATK